MKRHIDYLFAIDRDDMNGLPLLHPAARQLEHFKCIVERKIPVPGDADGRKKIMVRRYLAYIYFMVSKQFYSNLKPADREKRIKKQCGLDLDWVPDDEIKNAIEIETENAETISEKVLRTMLSGLFDYVDATEAIQEGMRSDLELFLSMVPNEADAEYEKKRKQIATQYRSHLKALLDDVSKVPTAIENVEKLIKQAEDAAKENRQKGSGNHNPLEARVTRTKTT